MEDRVKSTGLLIFNRIWEREKWVSLWFVIAIIIVIGCEIMTKTGTLNFTEAVITFLSKGKEAIKSLAVGYISGIFVYFLTNILSETQRSKPILVEVEKTLKYLADTLHDTAEFINSNDAVEITIQYIEQHGGKLDDNFSKLHLTNQTLADIHQAMETFTSSVLSHSPALTKHELDALVDIRHCRIARRIRFKYEINELFDKEHIKDDFREFVELNNNIIKLHENIRNRIYKQ